MESNDKLKEISTKNRTCYYFDDKIKFENFGLHNILKEKKSYKNILVYNISFKILIGANSLRIKFNKIDEFIRVFDKIRYLVLFEAEKYDLIYNRIIVLIKSVVFNKDKNNYY